MPRFLHFFIFAILFFGASAAHAQDETVRDLQAKAAKKIKRPEFDSGHFWKTGGGFNIHLGQGSQSNWSAGGDDFSFSLSSYLGLYAFYKKDRYSWDNTLDLNYGFVNTTSQGTRKNDDRIDFLSKVGYEVAPRLMISSLLNFTSQFSKGYNYKEDRRELLSDFLAPGYLLFSLGIDYKPVEGLSIFVSPITSRWVFVLDDSLAAKAAYGVDTAQNVKMEVGAFSSIKYLKNISETITYDGRLNLFSNYRHHPQNIDIMLNNKLTAKFSKTLSGSFTLDMIYDDDVKLFGKNNDSPAWQIKSLLGVGLNVKW